MVSSIGESLRRLRLEYDLSVSQVARWARISADRIAEIEDGDSSTVAELARLAGALGADPAMIYSGKVPPPTRTIARFRAPLGMPVLSGVDARLLARAAEAGRICADLMIRLRRQSKVAAVREIRNVGAHVPWQEGYALASTARKTLEIAPGAIVSVQRTLELLGVHVAFVDFETTDITAASLFEAKAAPVILLNSQVWRATDNLARRAVLAHELCHLLRDGGERDLTIVSRSDDDSVHEQRANGFAPNFLAPKHELRKDERYEALRDQPQAIAVRLATSWGLTFGGAVWHAKNTQLIDAATADQLQRLQSHPVIDRSRWEPPMERLSPLAYDVEVSLTPLSEGLLSDLTLMALAQGAISRGRAVELLELE